MTWGKFWAGVGALLCVAYCAGVSYVVFHHHFHGF